MKLTDKIISLFEKIFKRRKEEIKEISDSNEVKEEKVDFVNTIKIDLEKKNNNKVEVLVCYGDGLGIKQQMKY